MSTAVTPQSQPSLGPIDVSGPPVSFLTLVKVELRKSADTRAGFWLLLLTALFTVIAMVIVLAVTITQDVATTFDAFVDTTAYTSGFLLPVIGILLVTSEWSQRTAMVTFTLEPHRSRVIAAKAVAGLVLAGVVVLIALAAAVLANLLYAGIEGVDPSWEFSAGKLGGFVLSQAFAMLTGFALATLLLNTPAAIVIYFAYIFVMPAIFLAAAALLEWFADLQPWIDFNSAQVPLVEGAMQGDDWAHLLVSGLLWLALPVTLGVWRVLRAEVK